MGLDAVELVLKVEEAFQITILDEEAEKATTPGRLVDLVWNKVRTSAEPTCLSSRAFYLLRRRAMEEFKLPRTSFKPTTALGDVIPRNSRRESWERLKRAVGATAWPELRRPRLLLYALAIVASAALVVCTVLVSRTSGSWGLGFASAIGVDI